MKFKRRYLSIDTCPVKANVKKNNLKTNVKNRFDKKRIPKGDPDARLGAYAIFTGKDKRVQYFWATETILSMMQKLSFLL